MNGVLAVSLSSRQTDIAECACDTSVPPEPPGTNVNVLVIRLYKAHDEKGSMWKERHPRAITKLTANMLSALKR